jgi:hypothetical protein
VILPVNDPFWDKHHPGDRWGCKCSLRATDKPATPENRIPDAGDEDKPSPGLDSNPAKDAQIFSDNHPYNPPSCAACTLPGKRVISKDDETFTGRLTQFFNAGGKKDCYHCSKPVQLLKKAGVATKESKRVAKTKSFVNAKKSALQKVKKHTNKSITAANLQTGILWNSKTGLKNILNHSVNNEELKVAMLLSKNIDKFKFIRISPLGEGKDLSNPLDVINISKKRDKGIVRFNLYEVEIKGKTYYIKTAQNRKHGGYEELYTYTKKP